MSDKSKQPSAEFAKFARTTKGKREAPFDNHDICMPGPSSLAGSSSGVGQLPNLAPKPSRTNPNSAPAVASVALHLHKRPRVDSGLQTLPQLPPDTFARTERNPVSGNPECINLTNDSWSQGDILQINYTALGGSNAQPIVNVSQDPESQSQNIEGFFDPFSSLHNAPQAATALSFDPPSIFQPPPTTITAGEFQMPITQASVGCCPRCHAMLRNLRASIVAIECGQALASGGGMGELWKSYFGLEDHWNEGHVSGSGSEFVV